MLELFISPGKYVSGYDNIDKLGQEVEKLGKKPMVLFDKNIEKIIEKGLNSLKNKFDIEFKNLTFSYDGLNNVLNSINLKIKMNGLNGMKLIRI